MAVRLADAWLDDLRSRLDIVDVVSEYVALRQKGRRYWGLCPFHNEKTASFSVDSEAQLYYCFGCHEGGNVIHFIMELERMEFMEAVTLLAERVHLPLPERTAQAPDAPSRELKERLHLANKQAAIYYHNLLFQPEGAQVLSYLHRRGLDDSDIRKFGLGASGSDWRGLTEALLAEDFTEDELVKAGLTGRKEHRSYDMFRERAMFPIINAQGRVLGFGGRAMGDAQPKYLNTSDTPVFNKRQGLYAMNMVRKEGNQKRLILVEGYMDVVSLRRAGVQGVVATLGTALTEEQARLIKRYAPEVWVSYDGDAAGQKAILRALDIFEAQQIKARVLAFPDAMDPDDYVRMHGLAGFEALRPIDPVEYRMARLKEGYDLSSQEGRTEYAIECCKLLRRVGNPVELQNHLQRLMIETGFERQVLLDQIGTAIMTAEPARRQRSRGPSQDKLETYQKAEQTLIQLLAAGLMPPTMVEPADFDTELHRQIAELLLQGVKSAKVLDAFSDEQRKQAAQALNAEVLPDEQTALNEAESCLTAIRLHRIEVKIADVRVRIAQAGEEEQRDLKRQLATLLQDSTRLRDSYNKKQSG